MKALYSTLYRVEERVAFIALALSQAPNLPAHAAAEIHPLVLRPQPPPRLGVAARESKGLSPDHDVP